MKYLCLEFGSRSCKSGNNCYLCFGFLNRCSEIKTGCRSNVLSDVNYYLYIFLIVNWKYLFQVSNIMIIKQVILVLLSIISRNQDIRCHLTTVGSGIQEKVKSLPELLGLIFSKNTYLTLSWAPTSRNNCQRGTQIARVCKDFGFSKARQAGRTLDKILQAFIIEKL